MTQDEAHAEAVRRWGPNAYVEINHFKKFDVGVRSTIPELMKINLRHLYGWGDSWEEAFENADKGHHEQYQHPPKRTTQTGEEITQMRLFP